MDPDDTACYCMDVTWRKVINYIVREAPKRLSQLSECLGAGTGCGGCLPLIREIHRRIVAGEISRADDIRDIDYDSLNVSYVEEEDVGDEQYLL